MFVNITELRWVTFTLLGVPGLERFHSVISAPFLVMFLCSVIGNPLIVLIILSDGGLHSPMYVFLSLLVITDSMLSLCIAPQMLAVLWMNSRVVVFSRCVIQMYFVHFLTYMESGVLVAMAFDRYVAICQPLRYSAILTGPVITRISLVLVLRGVFMIGPCFYLVARLPYCGHEVISKSYCDHMSMAEASCGNTTINGIYGLVQLILTMAFNISVVILSYRFIIKAVLKLPSKEARSKAFGTCSSHVCVMSFFYIPGSFTLLAYRFGKRIPPSIHSLLSLTYLQMPPMMNPLVYGVRTRQIRDRVWKLFRKGKN
ncbi:PREDICTED: olfactory receptor 52Z1-like [Nanorana parkeri]|uniref:olfactory receptor 52Z1-like n=1 Tax=Nanorana parkeri TaxID=125878 RepID=UPI0008543D58|nr:PREDICTED: olfactory receptor 52Z1-like [Nanorana parkeri]